MRRKREQAGHVYRDGDFWYERHREARVINGVERRVRIATKLAPHKGMTKKRAQDLAKEKLQCINKTKLAPHTAVSLVAFTDNVYFPEIQKAVKPSTLRGYRVIWEKQLRPLCQKGNLWLRDVRTPHCQALLDELKDSGKLNINSMKHAKSFLSGIFCMAVRRGYYEGDLNEKGKANSNPVRLTEIRGARRASKTHAYSLEEVGAMLAVLPEPAATVVATAAYTGCRRGEIAGMTWSNYKDGQMFIEHSVWQGHITAPKSEESRAPVAIIPRLAQRLEFHRARLAAAGFDTESGPVFPNEAQKPMDLNNLRCRVIQPALNRCIVCKKSKEEHAQGNGHEYKRDESLPVWRGCHAFRRCLATELHDRHIDDKTIQAILRHSDVKTTQECYVKTLPHQVVDAMKKIEESAPDSALLASDWPVKTDAASKANAVN